MYIPYTLCNHRTYVMYVCVNACIIYVYMYVCVCMYVNSLCILYTNMTRVTFAVSVYILQFPLHNYVRICIIEYTITFANCR